jgi:hypothetical protein
MNGTDFEEMLPHQLPPPGQEPPPPSLRPNDWCRCECNRFEFPLLSFQELSGITSPETAPQSEEAGWESDDETPPPPPGVTYDSSSEYEVPPHVCGTLF